MFHKNVPKRFQRKLFLLSAYLINRMPSKILKGKIPVSILSPTREQFSPFPHVFGCLCFIHNHSVDAKKLDPRSIKVIFLGYSPTQKGYRCFDPCTGKQYVSRDVTFIEHVPYFLVLFVRGRNGCDEKYSKEQMITSYEFSLQRIQQFGEG